MQQIDPEGGPHASGSYTPGIRVGSFVFVSGQGPFDPESGELASTSLEGQVRATLANVERVLAAADASLRDVVRVDAYLADHGDFDAYDRVFGEVFAGHRPTRTTVQAGIGDIKIEISAVAHVAER